MRQLLRLLLLPLGFAFLATDAAAASDEPKIIGTPFGEDITKPLYFDDSDTVLVTSIANRTVYRSADGGATWAPLDGPEPDEVTEVAEHPYDGKTALVLGSNKHWITHDRGETWKSFESEVIPSFKRSGIAFHATDPRRMLFHVEECTGILCKDAVYYTTDSFDSPPKPLSDRVVSCLWAKSSDIFATGDEELDQNRILCVEKGKLDLFGTRRRITITDDYYETHHEPIMSSGQTIEGVVSLAFVKKYIVFASKGAKTTEMAMFVTDDTKTWHRAEFGEHRVEEGAYTLLESTNYSMQVDVMTSGRSPHPMGVLLSSNSNGTFFTKNIEHTNRGDDGYVDFEKFTNIQGIILVNVVQNWEDVEEGGLKAKKKVGSKISFDDGRTWQSLKVGNKDLHLHSVSEQHNTGRIFSSPAPGMVMGIGNTGDHLDKYEDGDLYISDDAGVTWTLALENPHLYEFGAQGSVLVAIREAETDSIQWSLDHGKTWKKAELPDGKVKPSVLTTTPDSTSARFLLVARKGESQIVYSINFKDVARDCGKSDFEEWSARVDDDGKATCIMGHKQSFKRRKANENCIAVSEDFKDPEETREQCSCTEQDFECDYNFKKEEGKCIPTDPIVAPEGACKGDAKTFKGPSGYRLIPGNDCEIKNIDLSEDVDRDCEKSVSPPATDGDIAIEPTPFEGSKVLEYFYLERDDSSSGDDETIIMRTDKHQVFVSKNHGKDWFRVKEVEDEKVAAIYPNPYNVDSVYLVTTGKKVFYSVDRMRTVHSFTVGFEAARDVQVLTFHPEHPDWLIWTGERDCDGDKGCTVVAEYSSNRGDDWRTLLRGVRKCEFVYRKEREQSDKLIYCSQHESEDPTKPLVLRSSDDHFETSKDLERNVVNFATMSEYIVVAVKDKDDPRSLKVDASIDGVTFADAKFPSGFKIDRQTAYTVLDSSTHAIFLHVTVQPKETQAYGSIIKSNSNGTHYVLSASEVNRSPLGYVDFEKMQGVEGVAIINRVANKNDVDKGKAKKLQTFISHNDGAIWDLLGRPSDPPSGTSYGCKKGSDPKKCSLHLHGYTERDDPRNTYSSPTAVGMLMGNGNVGESLKSFEEADTFLSRDGGLTWEFAARGTWMWAYGDMGSIIVIVKKGKTDMIRYSLDEGKTWTEYSLGEDVVVDQISTVPSDTSRNFILWGEKGGDSVAVNIDFSSLKERSKPCTLDEQHPGKDDYELWSPTHPHIDNDCLFGHVSQYHRKKTDAKCYNGKELQPQLSHLHNIAKNCTCTREDFECDYNYEPDGTGTCKLVPGLKKSDPAKVCKENPDLEEYNEITGYRRIPLTTCSGGLEMDYTSRKHPCPGKEDEFNKKHGISGAGLFFAIVIPIAAAAGAGYWVWKNWDGKFGQIRLGDNGGGGLAGAFDGEAPWIKYPVMALSGIIAVIAALPMVVGSVWKAVSTRLGRGGSRGSYARPYTSRSSFQRGRGDYSVVDEDEGELLGDSDEDL